MFFAPTQQLVPTKTRIASHNDPDLWPRLSDLPHNPFHLRHAAFGPIDIRRPQAGAQHILATDDVQRQVAVMPVVAVEEPRLDRKSTRLNSSHQIISYAVFCLK